MTALAVQPGGFSVPLVTDPQTMYAEMIAWSRWLDVFTASDLASVMAVDERVAANGIRALLWHGVCEETGDELLGVYGMEPVVRYAPLPPGPNEHFTAPPEWRTCAQDLVPPGRGMPIRVSAGEKAGKRARSTPGVRHKILLRDRRYEEQERARAERKQRTLAKLQREFQEGRAPKWRTRRKGGAVIQ